FLFPSGPVHSMYCGLPWDQYELCSTQFCCQLVLSCPSCRKKGCTACCPSCQRKGETQDKEASDVQHPKEECECTDTRARIPQDNCGPVIMQKPQNN
uniref:Rhodanase C-terminal domain-containing protein n=1 Tax=Xiphophorus couchianus TaxID=32473 RepID=A0A3B5MMI7_9TELE